MRTFDMFGNCNEMKNIFRTWWKKTHQKSRNQVFFLSTTKKLERYWMNMDAKWIKPQKNGFIKIGNYRLYFDFYLFIKLWNNWFFGTFVLIKWIWCWNNWMWVITAVKREIWCETGIKWFSTAHTFIALKLRFAQLICDPFACEEDEQCNV